MLAEPILHLLTKFIRWIGWPTALTLLLLAAAVGNTAHTLAQVVRGPHTGLLLGMAALGLLAGWLLAVRPAIPIWLAALLLAALGLTFIFLGAGRLMIPLTAAGQALLALAWQAWRDPLAAAPAALLAGQSLLDFLAAAVTLLTRLAAWLAGLTGAEPLFDPVAAAMVWGLAVWSVSAWAGYTQFRKQQSLAALTPAAALLATTLAYTLSHTGALLPIVAATLLLLGLTHYLGREQQWEAARTDYALDVRLDLGLAVVAITLGLTVMAGAAPAFSIKQIARLAQEYFQAAPVVNSLGMRRLPASSPLPTEVRAPGLPRRHLLGSGPELSKQVVMVITSADASAEPPRLYWRALTYDIYTGRGWLTSDTTAHDYAAGQPVRKPTAPARRPLRQTVQFVDNPNRLLFAAGEPVAADMPFTANRRSHADWFGAIIDAEIYQVDSLVPAASAQELRAAGSAYPNWLEQRYLRLPPTVPPRVLSLALDLTATAPTPFDRALAIEAYLRRIPYTLDLPEPPRRAEDMADYFLFDLRRGYCDYYATAMVVLARAAGLPARLAVGYVSNHYEAGRSLVTAADAHSWSEIYFPEHGWINFEPTGGRAALTRAPEPIALPPSIPFTAFVPPAGVRWWPWLAAPAGLIAAGLLGGLGWLAVDDWRLRRAAPAAAIDRIYRRLYRRGLALGAAAQPGHTPFEFAAAFSRRLTALSNARPRRVNLAAAPLAVERLAALLVQSRYSPHPPTSAHQSEAIRLWRQMRLHLWWAQFFGKTS